MYLVILTSTQRQNPDPKPLPAIQRYEGLYPSLLKSLWSRRQFPKCDVVFVTAQGVLRADQKVEASDSKMTPELAVSIRERNLQTLKGILAKKYDEIYVNVGVSYLRSIEGFQQFTEAKITYAVGVLGRKAVHMKEWGLAHSTKELGA
jgi:hypothetical protein